VLLTTFSKALANALKTRLGHLVGNEPEVAKRIAARPVTGIAFKPASEFLDDLIAR
jgi:superfamily I DNA/RNA helicase